MTDFWERMKKTGAILKNAAITTGDALKEAGMATGKTLKDAGQAAGRGATQGARGAADLYQQWFGEDVSKILTECPVATNILQHRESFEKDPDVFGRLYNVRTRPLVTAAVLACGGAGTAAFDEALSRVTRHIFDGDQLVGGALRDRIAELVGPEKAEGVNRFMDTVPGSDVMGGGWIHRIQHGHDVDALIHIGEEYGSEGVIQGAYHIFGRDFFTPAGIPILPSGSEQVHEFLMTNLNMTAEAAADLISLNSVELAAIVAIAMSVERTWDWIEEYKERKELRKLVERASNASEDTDYVTASALFQEALALRPQEGALSFALGMARYRTGNHLDAFLRFRDATSWLARTEPKIEIGGAILSLRGAAAGMALASIGAPARANRHGNDWITQLQQLATAGVTAFRAVGDDLVDTSITPARHLSAALNHYLAGKLVGGAMYLPERDQLLNHAHTKLAESLTVVLEKKSQHADEVGFMKRFAAAELLPLPTASYERAG